MVCTFFFWKFLIHETRCAMLVYLSPVCLRCDLTRDNFQARLALVCFLKFKVFCFLITFDASGCKWSLGPAESDLMVAVPGREAPPPPPSLGGTGRITLEESGEFARPWLRGLGSGLGAETLWIRFRGEDVGLVIFVNERVLSCIQQVMRGQQPVQNTKLRMEKG